MEIEEDWQGDLIKGYETLNVIDKVTKNQDFGHFKCANYPEQPVTKQTTVRIVNKGNDKRVYTTKELKSYILEKPSTFIDLHTQGDPISIKFRLPFDKEKEKWRILDELFDIDLPPAASEDLYDFYGEQRYNFDKIKSGQDWNNRMFNKMLVFPLGINDIERDEIVRKYNIDGFICDEQNLNNINDIFNKEGHLVFDVTLKRAALRPIQMIKKPMKGMRYKDVNLRIWIDNVPCYLF